VRWTHGRMQKLLFVSGLNARLPYQGGRAGAMRRR
jgi:hypothetical protein